MPDYETLSMKKRRARCENRTRKLSMRYGKVRVSSGKRSVPETHLLKWKFVEKVRDEISEFDDDQNEDDDQKSAAICRRSEKKWKEVKAVDDSVSVSARKLGLELWRLQLSVVNGGDCEMMIHHGVKSCGGDRLGFHSFQPHVGLSLPYHCNHRKNEGEANKFLKRPHSVSAHGNKFLSKLGPSFQFSNAAMEGATKWDPVRTKADDDIHQFGGSMMPSKQQVTAIQLVFVLEGKLKQATARVHELETEQTISKKKLEHFTRKLSEERSEWRRREHDKVHAYIENVKAEFKRETKTRQRMEYINSKLVNDLAEAKLSANQFMHGFEKERKTRMLMEQICEELANDFGEDKAQIEAMKRDSYRVREELEEERKMLQLAEVWREERVQMKLVDAKVALEEKYSQMKQLVADLETFLISKNATCDDEEIREAETLLQAASSVNIQEITKFSYEPTNHDDFLSVFQDVNAGKASKPNIRPCSVESEADGSEWDTVSQLEDIDSSNVSQSLTDWEFNVDEESRLSSQLKRASYPNNGEEIHKIILLDGMNGRKSNGRKSNASIHSQDLGSDKGNGRMSNVSMRSQELGSFKGVFSPSNFVELITSEARNPNVAKGMKGCFESPHGALQNSLKAKLLEARTESKKVQLRQILKEKI